tara:strand:- start:1736 stop:2887 length:1152 start_codon:yes stop_codon:yes gene_type:complete
MTFPLAELVEITGGGTPSKKIPEYWNGGIPWVSVKDFKNNRLSGSLESISEAGLKNSASNLIPKGTVIVPTRMALGKVAINSVDVAINQDLKALKIKDDKILNRDYLFRFLLSKADYFESRGKGATVKGITLDVLKELSIPLPPLEEQKRIAAILDKADAIRRKRQQAIELADKFLRSVFLDMFGDPVSNPKGWDLQPLERLVSKLGDGLHGTPTYSEDGEFHFINGNNLENGKIVVKAGGKRVDFEEYEKHKKDLNENSMLVSINGTIGKVAFYNNEQVVLGKSACYFNLLPDLINKVYLFHLIRSPYFLHYVEGVVTSSTIKNVSLKSMRELPIPMPPMPLQEQFEKLILQTQLLSEKMSCSEESLEHNFFSLTQKVFKAA